jgi:type II secretory ATPase GspE/PulE/Tfp pilus assembly ATPase PilB-like protein
LEDPVEYYIEGTSQSQIKPQIGYNFANGLRSIVRQDPDIIMVGEVRDFETAEMAVHAALTGHIVLSTLHTNDAAGAIPRLTDMKVEPFLIASSVNTVIAQRLVRKICPHCRKQYELSKDVLDDIKVKIEIKKMPPQRQKLIDIRESIKLYRGQGCDQCNGTGYKGRIGIFEILPVTPAIEGLLLKRVPASEIKNAAIKEGMLTMKQDGILKVLDGITTLEEVWRVTSK